MPTFSIPMRGLRAAPPVRTSSFRALAILLCLPACRVTTDEVHGWARKATGPSKLVAVLQHDKYERPLRVEAALTLATMKPRGGRNVGLQGSEDAQGLLGALEGLEPTARGPIVSSLAEPLARGILAPPGVGNVDPSIPYKDAAYALLTHAGGSLVEDEKAKARLEQALVGWTATDFVTRFDNGTQLYGMEQVLRLLGDRGVAPLTPLLVPGFPRLRELSDLIREVGSERTKLDASQRLTRAAQEVESAAWAERTKRLIEQRNREAEIQVSARAFEKQLVVYRTAECEKIFGAMRAVGQKPAADFLLGYAGDARKPAELRALALASLEGHVSRSNPEHARALIGIAASNEATDTLRDLALKRAAELPYDQIAPGLFELFDAGRWKVRWVAASLLLRLSDAAGLERFMNELGRVKSLPMAEALSYGALLDSVSGIDVRAVVTRYSAQGEPAPVRLSALSHYYGAGTQADVARLRGLTSDPTSVPPCPSSEGPRADPDAGECAYVCVVTEGDQKVEKEVRTVGQFVQYCIIPAAETRSSTTAAKPAIAAPSAEGAAPSAAEKR